MDVRPSGPRPVDRSPEIHPGGFVAVGAAETVFEKDRRRHQQPVAAQQGPGFPVFHAALRCEHRSPAQRAPRARRRDPLDDDQNQNEDRQTRSDHRHFTVVGHHRVNQQTCGDRGEQAVSHQQKSGEPETHYNSHGAGVVHDSGTIRLDFVHCSEFRLWGETRNRVPGEMASQPPTHSGRYLWRDFALTGLI